MFATVAFYPLLDGAAPRPWALAIGAAFGAAALLAPRWLIWPNRVWATLGDRLHRIMTPVLLAVIYFLVLTPTALLMRGFGKRPLELRFDPAAASYWKTRDPAGDAAGSMRNQF